MEATLSHYFGYDKFRPGQKEIITKIMDHHNVLGVLPTGCLLYTSDAADE